MNIMNSMGYSVINAIENIYTMLHTTYVNFIQMYKPASFLKAQ